MGIFNLNMLKRFFLLTVLNNVCAFSSQKVVARDNARALTFFHSQMIFILHLLSCDLKVQTFEKTLSCIQGSFMKNSTLLEKSTQKCHPCPTSQSYDVFLRRYISLLFPLIG